MNKESRNNTSALPNADSRRGGKTPSSARLTSCTSPEVRSDAAENSQTGVSSDYAQEEKEQWFVLRATYGRTEKAIGTLQTANVETYLPMHYVIKEWEAKVRTRAFASQYYFCKDDPPENSRFRERASPNRQMAKILHGQDKARGKINRQESSRNHPRQRNDKLHPPDKRKQRAHHGTPARTLPLQERRLGENHRRSVYWGYRKGCKSCRSATCGGGNRRTMQHSHSIHPE